MNLLGKIFVVLILIMSVVFMSLALAVYATHRNWKAEADTLRTRLQEANARFDQKQTEFNELENRLTAERDAERQRLAKSEAERDALIQRNAGIQAELDQLKAERRDATAAVAVTQQNNQKLAEEVTALRDDIRTNQLARDRAFAATLQATEELHQVKGELDSTLERSRQLTSQVANYTDLMRASGVDPNTPPDAVVPTVDGLVSRVRQSGGAQLVEVTIGADDGLKQGHTVEVYRGDRYLGRVEIFRTSPDRAVGRVDRRFQQGRIVEGDRVATRFQFD